MTFDIFNCVGFYVIGLLVFLAALSRAKYGYEDETGFHFGRKGKK